MRYMKLLAIAAVCVGVVVAIVASAGGQATPTREGAKANLASRFKAFRVPQSAADTFESHVPAFAQAARDIAATSRRVAADADGELFAFVNSDQKVCVLYRPAERSFGASSCGPADAQSSPSILVYYGQGSSSALVAGLVQDGSGDVTVSDATGRQKVSTTTEGGFVYRGKTPFTVNWTEPSGREREVNATTVDVTKLQRVG